MTEAPAVSPGTVSKILWHFTGGPTWNAKQNRQNHSPKPAVDAYANLRSILGSRHLRLGNYKEVINVVVPEFRKVKSSTKKQIEILKSIPLTLQSAPVLLHIRYSSATSLLPCVQIRSICDWISQVGGDSCGVQSVFYTLDDTAIIHTIYRGLSELQLANVEYIRDAADSIEYEISHEEGEHETFGLDVSNDLWQIEQDANSVEAAIATAKQSVETFMSFVKTFNRDEFSTIYCEREWRSTSQFDFTFDDIAIVVLPRRVGSTAYFKNFVERVAPRLGLPRRMPIVPWDDLIEH